MFRLVNSGIFSVFFFFFFFGFSGFGKDESNYIDLSGIRDPWNLWPIQETLLGVFGRAGFANSALGTYKLRPCSLGTFVNSSASDPRDYNCLQCPAGKFALNGVYIKNHNRDVIIYGVLYKKTYELVLHLSK